MTPPRGPRLDERRANEFLAELVERARAWIPGWDLGEAGRERDFGVALLEIAARFNSEVAERLDRGAEKMLRGFVDWLGVRGLAARAARVPVVLTLADTATEGVFAQAPVRLQADADGTPVTFETETGVRVVPGRVALVVGVDVEKDAFYLPWEGLSDLQPLEPQPAQWLPKASSSAGASTLQLDPDAGLGAGTLLEIGGRHYRIVGADKGLVTIEPPLESALEPATVVTRVSTFAPFGGAARNWQRHALYLGDAALFDIEGEARIEVLGSARLASGFAWQYWGKNGQGDEEDWWPLPPETGAGGVVLLKPTGEMTEREVGGRPGRWIRAYAPTIDPGADPVTADAFSIRINSTGCGAPSPQCPAPSGAPSAAAEAMANTTPLVLDSVFLPLGREPRQFDTFYLASAEAFSKKGAQVDICFELAEPTFASLAAVRDGLFANLVIAGVGKDRALHLFQFTPSTQALASFRGRGALRPPSPGAGGVPPESATQVRLNPECRPVFGSAGFFSVHVAAGAAIWTWQEVPDPNASGWKKVAPLPDLDAGTREIDDIVPVAQADTRVVLSHSELWVMQGGTWQETPTKDPAPLPAGTPVTLVALVPVATDTAGVLVRGNRMVGVSDDQHLYEVDLTGSCRALPLLFGVNEALVDNQAAPAPSVRTGGIRPAAYSGVVTTLVVVAPNDTREKLLAYVEPGGNALEIDLPDGDVVDGTSVDLALVNGLPQFSVLCRRPDDTTYAASWQPTHPTVGTILFRSADPPGSVRLNGPPVTLAGHLIAPGTQGDLLVASFDASQRRVLAALPAEDGVVVAPPAPVFAIADEFSVLDVTGDRIRREVTAAGISRPPDPEVLYPVDSPFGPIAQQPDLLGYQRSATQFTGGIVDVATLTLDPADDQTVAGTVLIVDAGGSVEFYEVIDDTSLPDVVVVPDMPASSGSADYWTPITLEGRVSPIVRLDATTGDWEAALVAQSKLYFPTADPPVQLAKAFGVDANQPRTLALSSPWVAPPAAGDLFVIDTGMGAWRQVLADASSNPELSWEYSNGTAWNSLPLDVDGTLNLKRTGGIRFTVPDDLAPSDWAGKTNHWIRARLIGGDYGREKVTVTSRDLGNQKTEQVVERSTDGIRPPAVVSLHIAYRFCDGVRPAWVLTEDSGSTRDQSDANRAAGAVVEAFVPLSVSLGRLMQTPTASQSATQLTRATGRSLFVGLTKEPDGEPVNLLLLVDAERDYADLAPLAVSAHVADRFSGVEADDRTRGLGESGLVAMAFSVPPTLRELFGHTLAWLHLAPSRGSSQGWAPTLRGAYLNGVWASATETLTRELLGSSTGEPDATFTLARPPLLADTLELRVREPLGEEERAAIREAGDHLVLSDVDGLPGDWVLWTQVPDPGDALPGARVYALDEATGVVRFGDALHGAIPPIGTDSIVAFSYKRTEPGAPGDTSLPGNAVAARTAMNLQTPIEGAESAIAADQAAGGAPPEDADRAVRFGLARLRHRNRAVSVHDLEELALQSSPEIVQARAIVRQGSVRLVIVMRGRTATPNAGQVRELTRLLLDAAPVALSARQAFRITGPVVRRLRVELTLRVATLADAGDVSRAVRRRLVVLFDSATGGGRQDGWPLGASPNADDVAYALVDVPRLQALVAVRLREVSRDGTERPWPSAIQPTALAVLADEAPRIHFESAEAVA